MAIITLNNRSINRSDTASADQVWTATSATASDFQAAVGGKVLQIVQATDTTTRSTTATSFEDLGWTALITPSATSSKILVHATCFLACSSDHVVMRLMRDTTAIGTGVAVSSRPGISGMYVGSGHSGINQTTIYLDSPSSTSELTYKIQWYKNSTTAYNNRTPGDLDYIVGGRGISMLQLMEIGA